jgi:hypothetical protein
MTISDHDFQMLLDLSLNEGSPEATAWARARVAQSSHLQATLGEIQRLVEAMRKDDTVLPAHAVIERAKALAAAAPGKPSLAVAVGTMIASLVYDSRVSPALAGFRGAGNSARHLVYRCDAGQLDLSVSVPRSPAQAWSVRGQFEGAQDDSSVTVLAHPRDGGADSKASAPAGGDFVLSLPSGEYDLDIRMGETVVRVECLELR